VSVSLRVVHLAQYPQMHNAMWFVVSVGAFAFIVLMFTETGMFGCVFKALFLCCFVFVFGFYSAPWMHARLVSVLA
jgi:hypothetical protein